MVRLAVFLLCIASTCRSFFIPRKAVIWSLDTSKGSNRFEDLYESFPDSTKYLIESNITKIYPTSKNGDKLDRDLPDFTTLKPNDPLFLDMAWPSARSPAASAFAKHLQWRRALTDGERKWAYYLLCHLLYWHHIKVIVPPTHPLTHQPASTHPQALDGRDGQFTRG